MDTEPVEPQKYSEAETLTTLQVLIGGIAKKYGMRVEIGPEGSGTFFNFRDVYVQIDAKDLRRSPEEWMGAGCHEAEHVDISRSQVIPEEDWNSQGFNALHQTLEDLRVNTGVEKKFPGAGEWVRKIVKGLGAEGERLNLQELIKKTTAEFGFLPRSLEFTVALQNSWAWGEYHIPLRPEVERALIKTKPFVDKYRNRIPPTDEKEIEKQNAAFKNYKLQKTKIQPVYDALQRQDKEDLELMRFVGFLSTDEGKEYRDIIDLELDDSEKGELNSIIENEKRLAEEAKKNEAAKVESSPVDKLNFVDTSSMSKGLREKLNKMKDQINDKKRKEFKDKAQEDMDDLQDQIVEKLRSKLQNPVFEPTKEELKDTGLMQALLEASKKAADAAQEENQREREANKTDYDKILNEVAPYIDELVEKLEDVLAPNKFPRFKKGYASGEKLTLQEVMEFEADRRRYNKLFEKKTLPDKRDYGVTLVVDLSWSMNEKGKLLNAKKAVVIFAETLDRLGINFEILGYNSGCIDPSGTFNPIIIKDYYEKYESDVKERVANMQANGTTPTAEGVRDASNRANNFGVSQPIIINLTDGDPNDKDELTNVLTDVDSTTNQTVIGVGLGAGISRSSIEDVYPVGRYIPVVEELPGIMGEVLESVIV